MIGALGIGVAVAVVALIVAAHFFGPLWKYLDPNPRFKVVHVALGAAACFGLLVWPLVNHGWLALLLDVAFLGACYEAIETVDAVIGSYGPGKIGQPGYGFSWRDIVADVAGAAILQLGFWLIPVLFHAVR